MCTVQASLKMGYPWNENGEIMIQEGVIYWISYMRRVRNKLRKTYPVSM